MNSFSQTDTTKVCIPTKVARQAAKDLVRYDGCKEELKLTQLKVTKLEEREVQKDTIISLLTSKDKNNQYGVILMRLGYTQSTELCDRISGMPHKSSALVRQSASPFSRQPSQFHVVDMTGNVNQGLMCEVKGNS